MAMALMDGWQLVSGLAQTIGQWCDIDGVVASQ